MPTKMYLLGTALALITTGSTLATASGLAVSTATGKAGDTVQVNVDYQAVSGVVAIEFELSYDPAKLTPGAVVSTVAAPHSAATNVIAPGTLKVLVPVLLRNPMPPVATSNLVTVPFTVSAQAAPGAIPVVIKNMVLADGQGNAVATAAQAGEVVVQ